MGGLAYNFPLEEDETVLKKSMATLDLADSYVGALYLTNFRLVFVGYMPHDPNKYMYDVPLVHIRTIKPVNTLLILRNGIFIETIRDERLRIIISKRDEWLQAIEKQSAML